MASRGLGNLFVNLGLNSAEFIRNLDQATKKLNSNVAQMKRSMNNLEKGFNQTKNLVVGLGAAFAGMKALETASAVLKVADSYNTLQGRIKQATKDTGDFAAVNKEISNIAKTTGTRLEENVESFQRLSIGAKELGKSNTDVLKLIKVVDQLGVIGGSSGEAMKAGQLQFGQAMSAGIVRAEEFNSILENMPEVANRIAGGLGVSLGQLRKLVLDGKLLSKDVFEALLKQSDQIQKDFDAMPVTMERGFNKLQISLTESVGRIDQATGATRALAKMFSDLADWIDKNQVGIAKLTDYVLKFGETAVQLGTMVISAIGVVTNAVATGILNIIGMTMSQLEGLVNNGINSINTLINLANKVPGVRMNTVGQFRTPGHDTVDTLAQLSWRDTMMFGSQFVGTGKDILSGKSNFKPFTPQTTGSVSNFKLPASPLDPSGKKKGKQKKSDAEKELDRLKAAAKSLKEEVRTPLEVYRAGVAEADKMLKLHLITLDEYNKKLEKLDVETRKMVKLNPGYDELSSTLQKQVDLSAPGSKSVGEALTQFMKPSVDALDNYKVAWDEAMDKIKDGQSIYESVRTPAENFSLAVEKLNQRLAEGDVTQETYNRQLKALKDEALAPILTPMEQYAEKIKLINELNAAGALDQEQMSRQVMVAEQALKDANDGMRDNIQNIETFLSNFGQNFENTFFDSMQGAKASVSDFVSSALEDIGRLIFRLTVTIPLANALSNALLGKQNAITGARSGGWLSNLLGMGTSFLSGGKLSGGAGQTVQAMHFPGVPVKAFADGGTPPVNQVSLVGERGPELFVPRAYGTVIPNHELGGGAGGSIQINNYINVQGGGGTPEQNEDLAKAIQKQFDREGRTLIVSELTRQMRPGGILHKAPYQR